MKRPIRVILAPVVAGLFACTLGAQTNRPGEADALYRLREDLSNAARAAELWEERSVNDFDAAWKLARACYWLGTHQAAQNARDTFERGIRAGEGAIGLANGRPEGHFWLAANMGRLAESFGILQELKWRGRIKDELERVAAIDASWQGGAADDALGQWYATVPRLFGGSRQKAEQHLRRALQYDANNASALVFLGDMLIEEGRTAEARTLLRRVFDVPFDAEWAPENQELKKRGAALLEKIDR